MKILKERLPKVLFKSVACFFVIVAVFELLARFEDYIRFDASPFATSYSMDDLFHFVSHGKQGKPNAKFQRWQLNKLGYRGNIPKENSQTILVIGASESFGVSERNGAEYPAQLQKLFDEGKKNFSIVNASVPGFRHGYSEYVKHAIQQTKPTYVLIYPSPANYIGTEDSHCSHGGLPKRAHASSQPNFEFRITSKLKSALKTALPIALLDLGRKFLLAFISENETIDVVANATIDAYGADLQCVIALVRKNQAVPILMNHATIFGGNFTNNREQLTAWRSFYPALREGGFSDLEKRANERAAAVAKESQTPFINLADNLKCTSECFADFVHFNDRGAAQVASVVYKKILELEAQEP